MFRRFLLSSVLWSIMVPAHGCIFIPISSSYKSKLKFSPDSSTVAWVSIAASASLVATYHQTACINWCSVDAPEFVRTKKVDSVGLDYDRCGLGNYIHFISSPDSRHLAVVARGRLSIIDLHSGKLWRLTPRSEIVTSFVWSGDDELQYAAHSNIRGKYDELADRVFWKHDIHASIANRVELLSERGIEMMQEQQHWFDPLEHWSPDGRYVIFMSPYFGRFHCLAVSSGRVRIFGQENSRSAGVAWAPSGTTAACFSAVRGERHKSQAILLDAANGEILDFTTPLTEVVGPDFQFLSPSWTADGEYLVVNSHRMVDEGDLLGDPPRDEKWIHEYHLVRPKPWEVIPVGRMLEERFPEEDISYLTPSAVPGWIHVRIGKVNYAVDYHCERLVSLGETPLVYSADGSWAAEYPHEKQVKVYMQAE